MRSIKPFHVAALALALCGVTSHANAATHASYPRDDEEAVATPADPDLPNLDRLGYDGEAERSDRASLEFTRVLALPERPNIPSEWTVTLRNHTSTAIRGELLLGTGTNIFLNQAVEVRPYASARIHLTGLPYWATRAVVLENGRAITSANRHESGANGAQLSLLDLSDSISPKVSVFGAPSPVTASIGGMNVMVRAAVVRPTDVLPISAGGYAGADLILIKKGGLDRFTPEQTSALSEWLLAGGTLAVTDAQDSGRDASFAAFPRLARMLQTANGASNLRPGPFGLVAAYGFGRVILLPQEPRVNDVDTLTPLQEGETPQTNSVSYTHLSRLVADSARRGHGEGGERGRQTLNASSSSLRDALDPNRRFPWALGAAGLLLLAHALIAGPLLYRRARRRGALSAPIWFGPALGIVSFGAIVGAGRLTRGWGGEAREVVFIDTAPGMGLALATSVQSVYRADGGAVTFSPRTRGGTVELVDATVEARLSLQDGHPFVTAPVQPWTPLLVREEFTQALGQGVALGLTTNGEVTFRNNSPYALRDVFVRLPSVAGPRRFCYLERLAPGESGSTQNCHEVRAELASFEPLGADLRLATGNIEGLSVAQRDRVRDAWGGWSDELLYAPSFWDPTTPVLAASIADFEGKAAIGGVAVKKRVAVLHVKGEGGAP